MSLDQRLRDALQHSSSIVEPDVRRNLTTVRRKAHRAVIRQRMSLAVLSVALMVGAVLAGPAAINFVQNLHLPRPAAPSPAVPSAPVPSAIVGTYTATLPSSSPILSQNQMAGAWIMTLRPDGTVDFSAPPSVHSALAGYQYSVLGTQFRINVQLGTICRFLPPGTYEWDRADGQLTFIALDDTCPARVALLTSTPWQAGN
jgi:hypothetical protein